MGEFIEERLDTCVRLGAAAEDSYFVETTITQGGSRYSSLRNGKPYREFNLDYIKPGTALALSVASLYHRTWGGFAGFRVKSWDDYTTANDGVSAYTALDCDLPLVSAGIYQLVKEYGREGLALASIGRPKRTLYKPVAGNIAVGVAGAVYPTSQWSADSTTGQITMAANKSRSITGITQASSAVLEVGTNTFLVGESVAISDVAGMTQINGLRALVTAKPDSTHITVAINSSGFSAYTSGGAVQTQPIAGESVTGGCEFDIPCAFDSKLGVDAIDFKNRDVSGLRVVEILNP
nr:DUF2460 domain-containing protein [uncultured Pseudomonas sp.]